MLADGFDRARDTLRLHVPSELADYRGCGFDGRIRAVAEGWTAVGGTLREASEADAAEDLRVRLGSASEAVRELAGSEAALYRDALAALDRTPARPRRRTPSRASHVPALT
jgi:hypothetical protein